MINYKAIVSEERERLEAQARRYSEIADEQGWNALDAAERARFDALDATIKVLDRIQRSFADAENDAVEAMAADYAAKHPGATVETLRDIDGMPIHIERRLEPNETICSGCGAVVTDDEIVFIWNDTRLCDPCDRERIAQEFREGERP